MTEESANFDAPQQSSAPRPGGISRRFPSTASPTSRPTRHVHRIRTSTVLPAPTRRQERHVPRIPPSTAGSGPFPREGRNPTANRLRPDDGLAEFVVCLPVFFLLVIAGIQFSLWSHASHLARAAAEQGSQVASGYGSTPAAGTQAAYQFIASTGPGTLANPQVATTTLAGDVAQVTVTGRAQALIPWFSLTVSATSDAPVQRYRASG